MPFYQTGRVRKDPISEADVEVVLDLLDEVQPTNIFVVGDLSDPHGTHRMCYQAIDQALQQYRSAAAGGDGEMSDTNPDPQVWLYRGAWQEWETYRADVFLPLSKADLDRKVEALYKHGSQKDRATFPGAYDEREFWQRARDRNCDTANTLNQLGLSEFYATGAFVTTYQMP
jgi:glucosamine-6-phosphate deaminase